MSPKSKRSGNQNAADELAQRIDRPAGETVLTLATSADRQRLRNELLRLILKSESRRKTPRTCPAHTGMIQDVVTTEGSANLQVEAAEA